MSTLHPQESALEPPLLKASEDRDVQFGFSDYVVNTLFDALHAEHIGESQIRLPFVKTIFDKECPKCPIVLQSQFPEALRQIFLFENADIHVKDMTLDIGALNNESKVLPMVTLSVNATAGVAFSLSKRKDEYDIKATLSLEDLAQKLVVSHIGPIDMSDLTRDLKLLINDLFSNLNKDIPALPIPSIGGLSLAQPKFTIADRTLLLEADVAIPHSTSSPVIVV